MPKKKNVFLCLPLIENIKTKNLKIRKMLKRIFLTIASVVYSHSISDDRKLKVNNERKNINPDCSSICCKMFIYSEREMLH